MQSIKGTKKKLFLRYFSSNQTIKYILITVALTQFSCQYSPGDRVSHQRPANALTSSRSFDNLEQGLSHAKALLSEGKIEEAATELKEMVFSSPDNPSLNLLYASALLQLGKTDDAKQYMSRIVEKWPELSSGRLLMGYALVEKGEKKEAIEQFQKVLSISHYTEERLSAHLALASIYEEEGAEAKATRHYVQALTIEPTLGDILIDVQKELLWHEPQSIKAKDVGELESYKSRQKRMESQLKSLHD
jgi:tetratricopeptide (TPR) repeat protein